MPVPCFSTRDELAAALACDGTINATAASTSSAPSVVAGLLLFSNPDGSVVILISLQKRQDAPGGTRQANGEPRPGLSQAAAEAMRSQPAQASPASTGDDGAAGSTRGEDRPRGSRPPHP